MSPVGTQRTLLVPVSLEALVVSGGKAEAVKNLAPRFDLFGRKRVPPLGRSMRAEPWNPQIADVSLEIGIHLHWALPAALTHGIQSRTGEIEFPPVPNRWVVLRVPVENHLMPRAWVLQSDYLGPEGTNHFLIRDGNKYTQQKIGRAYEYDRYEENAPSTDRWTLTAVGPGNPAFAAFYPGCRNVFGFHDDLKGVDNGTFMYFLAGWYARLEDDPLYPENTLSNKKERLQDLKERWLGPSSIPGIPPTRTLCHSTLNTVKWNRAEKLDIPKQAPFRIAVGNTATEALGALVARNAPKGAILEPLLSAFQYGILANLDLLYGVPELDAELHRRRFYPVEGGTQWSLRSIAQAAGTGKRPPFPEDSKETFNDLCERQRGYDRIARELTSLREQYYAAWFRSKQKTPPDGLDTEMSSLGVQITKTAGTLQSTLQEIERLRQELKRKGIRLPVRNGETPPPAEYELIGEPMPEFWRASDPAILLALPGNPTANRYGGRPEKPQCRVLDDVLAGLNLTMTDLGRQRVTVGAAEVNKNWEFPLTPKDGISLPFDEVTALYYESLLVDSNRAEDLAHRAYALCSQDQKAGSALVKNLATKIRNALQQNLGESEEIKIEGKFPVQAIGAWTPDWNPLFMVWEIDWFPDYTESGQWNQDVKWKLRNDTEYACADQPADTGKAVRRYRAWAPLSLSLSQELQKQLRDAPAVAKAFEEWSFITQSTNGLTAMLILQEETLQLPPLRDKEPNKDTLENEVWDLLGREAMRWSPLEENPEGRPLLFPIRAGHLRITRLWLVDAFGRVQKVIDEDLETVGENMVVAESLGGAAGSVRSPIVLPPRIVQPSRLLCRWVSVADERNGRYQETNSSPSTDPIVGWVVPNHFDRGLVVCDRRGKIRGELRKTQKGGEGITWFGVPGSEAGSQEAPSLSDADAFHLQQFVDGFRGAEPATLGALLRLIDQISLCITTPAARQVQTLSVLLGQPLVLVRASLELQVWGRLATDPPWADPPRGSDGGLRAAKFPVRLGDVRRSNDGLVGYFVGTDYNKIRMAFAAPEPKPRPSPYFGFNDDLELSLETGRVNVTLLMDPRAGVHVTSGILPVQHLELPEHVVSGALDNIELSFRVGPFLGNDESFTVPVPDDVAGSWSWFDFDRARPQPWRENPDVGKAESAPAVPTEPARIYEGWLAITKTKQSKTKQS